MKYIKCVMGKCDNPVTGSIFVRDYDIDGQIEVISPAFHCEEHGPEAMHELRSDGQEVLASAQLTEVKEY